MRLNDYIRVFRQRIGWLMLAAMVVAGLMFVWRVRQPLVYSAQTTISVGGYIRSPNPDTATIRTGVELAQTYAFLATSRDVLQAAIDAEPFPRSLKQVRTSISADVIPNTSLLKIRVTDTDAVLAANLANEVAQQLILHSPSNLTAEQESQLAMAQQSVDDLSHQVQTAREQLKTIDEQLEIDGNNLTEGEWTRLASQRNLLVEQINEATANQVQFLSIVAGLQERSNSLDIVEQAHVPTESDNPSLIMLTILGAFVGGVLAAVAAVGLEYLNETVRTPDDVTETMRLPILAAIPPFGRWQVRRSKSLITVRRPGNPISERYRILRAKLLLTNDTNSRKPYVITSPSLGEGKSVTAANLAVVMASANLRVLLVDADLRRPSVHRIFNLSNNVGLADLLSSKAGTSTDEITTYRQCIQTTPIPGLHVITSGVYTSDPAEILGSALMQKWLLVFKETENFDVILFDTPPALVVSDSLVLSATVGAAVILVLRAGKTHLKAALETHKQFQQLDVETVGGVLNFVRPQDVDVESRTYYYRRATSLQPHRNGKQIEPVEEQPENVDDLINMI